MSRVLFDLRYAARKFLRTPWLTLALLLSIGLGIGGNVSVFEFARGLTRVDSPLASIGRIVSIFHQSDRAEAGPLAYAEYLSLERDIRMFDSRMFDSPIFEWIGAARVQPASIGLADQSVVLFVAAVTSDLAGALNLPVQQGVVISRRLWRNQFGEKNAMAGEHILIDGVKTRVSGVAPERLEELYRGRAIDIWEPLQNKDLTGAERVSRNFWVLARLRPNCSIRQAQDAIRPSHGDSALIVLRPYTGITPEMEEAMSRIATLFGFAASAVFFVACVNVVFFLLGRAFARSYETSVRVALGANRRQLASELFCDSFVISLAGGAAGFLLAFWTSHIVPALLSDQDAEQLLFSSGFSNIAVASGACAAGMILCGLIPLFVERHNRPAAVLNRESAGPSKASVRIRTCLVLLQAAVCSTLVISTAYLVSCLHAALETGSARLGNPILVTVQAQPIAGFRYFQHVQQAVQSMAGVSETAWAGSLPGAQPAWRTFRIEPRDLPLRDISLDTAWFTGDSLKLFHLPPKSGRMFGFEDQTCRVAIVNTAASAQLFGSGTPGRTIQNPQGLPVKIVGVVETTNEQRPAIYYNMDQTGPAPSLERDQRFRAPVPSKLLAAELNVNVVSQSYFAAMGVSLISGREFTHPPASGECRIAVINREAARLYFGNQPMGAAVIDDRGARTAIAGVIDANPLAVFERRAEPAIYFPMLQDPLPRMTLIVLASHAAERLQTDLLHRINSVPGRGPAPIVIKSLAGHLEQTALAPLRVAMIVIGASASIALLLSILGLFGALSEAARQRRRELAIRIALGAQRWRIVCLFLREGSRLAFAGILLGMLASLALLRLLARIAPANSRPAVWVWLIAPALLALAVAIASVLPARRALLVNPATILRDEN